MIFLFNMLIGQSGRFPVIQIPDYIMAYTSSKYTVEIQNPMLRPASLIHVLQLSNHPKSKMACLPWPAL